MSEALQTKFSKWIWKHAVKYGKTKCVVDAQAKQVSRIWLMYHVNF